MTHRTVLHTSSDSCVLTCMNSTYNHSHEARMTHHTDVWLLKIKAVWDPFFCVCSPSAVVSLHLGCTSTMPQGGLHILQHYPHPLHRMAYHSLLLLYCTVSNRPPQNDILLFVLQAQEAYMLCRIGSHLTGGQSNTRKLQALSRMFYQREACSGTKRVTHSQSRSRSCLPCRESGKSCI